MSDERQHPKLAAVREVLIRADKASAHYVTVTDVATGQEIYVQRLVLHEIRMGQQLRVDLQLPVRLNLVAALNAYELVCPNCKATHACKPGDEAGQ